ncbi:MAG: hypothetical protein IVW54_09440 [Candidatus Binataceae bacterium]|nr:hypothetical protein [Candidatus Binataceae bacterium]
MNLSSLLDVSVAGVTLGAAGFALGTLFGHWLAVRLMAAIHGLESRLAAVEHALGLGGKPVTSAPAKALVSTPAPSAAQPVK